MRVDHCVFERSRVAASWHSMPPTLRLVSPWWTNVFGLRDVFRHFPLAKVGAEDFARYLERFQQRHSIAVTEHCDVLAITPVANDTGFAVTTSAGTVTARIVVCATGYFGCPSGPEPAYESDGSVPTIHAANYRGPEAVRSLTRGQPVLIVGRRISAGQLMVELHDQGIVVALSTRSAVEFRQDGVFGALKDFAYYFYEEGLIAVKPRLRLPSFPVMDGGRSRRLFEAGRISVHPAIQRIWNGMVEFHDGSSIRPGLVIHATGYRPVLAPFRSAVRHTDQDGLPLCHDWESVDSPGLFFLGLDNRRNYRSRTIRGIRRDSVQMARLIAARIRGRRRGQLPRA